MNGEEEIAPGWRDQGTDYAKLVCDDCESTDIKIERKKPKPPRMLLSQWADPTNSIIRLYNVIYEATCQQCGAMARRPGKE